MIIKNIDDADDWTCYHEGAGNSNYLTLNSTAAATDGTMFNDTTPTSTVFTLGAAPGSDYHNRANRSGYDYIAYLWHDVPGLQKFGSYLANGAADGAFVELGFRPALVWIKSESFTNSYTNWDINDSVRDTYNPADATLAANLSDAENSANIGTQKIDFLSNGFKIRQEPTSSSKNTSGETYIYCAWAEAPSVDLYGCLLYTSPSPRD